MNPSSQPLSRQEFLDSQWKPTLKFRLPPGARLFYWVNRHWLLVFSIVYNLFVGLPFLAPVFMQIGWEGPGRAIYFIYTFLCHQLPQRSFFLFGPKTMYNLSTIQTVWENTMNPLILRQFIGNPDMGWKVAWSDRMVFMYTSVLVFAWIWYPLRKWVKPMPWWGFVLFLLPMAIDGSTHFISDIAGFGNGFRYTNEWQAALTNGAFSPSFYAGNALGSFNSLMRLLTGLLFGIGVVWFAFPYLEEMANQTMHQVEAKIQAIKSLSERLFNEQGETS